MINSGKNSGKSAIQAILICVLLLPIPVSLIAVFRKSSAPPLAITQKRASLVFSEYLIHYGLEPIESKAMEEVTFFFHNVGESPVQIDKLRPSCGCLSPKLTQKQFAPGEGGRLTIPIAVAKESPGFHEYLVTVEYRDPEPKEVTLTVKMVLPEKQILIEPRALWVIGGSSSRSIEHTIKVTDFRSQPLTVTEVSSSSELFTPEIRETVSQDGSSTTNLAVRIADTLPDGIHRGIIQVLTSDPENRLLHIPVMARGKERTPEESIQVRPELVAVNAVVDPAARKSFELTFPASWKVSRLDSCPLELNTEFEDISVANSGRTTLRVTVSFGTLPPSQIMDGVVTLIADDGKHQISVPLQIHWPRQE